MTRSVVRIALMTLTVSVLVPAAIHARVISKSATGSPEIKSINVIGFAPDGVLLIGDGRGSQVFAVETGDTKPGQAVTEKLDGVTKQLAARVGTSADGIEIVDMAVNPASGKAWFAVRKQDDKSHILLTVSGAGEIEDFPLEDVTYARVELNTDSKVQISTITDVAWADDRIIAAGRSNESFASKIFSVDAPVSHEEVGASYSAETYHVSHRRWETKAPMSVVLPFREDDQTYVVGAFSCTPVVKYPIDALKPGATVKGTSIIELGSGNRPIDMFVYEKDGKPFVLANTFRFHHERRPFGPSPYWTVKFEQSLLSEDSAVNEDAIRRLGKGYKPATERIEMIEAFHGVAQMDKLDDKHALVLRKTDSGFDLEPLALP